MRSVIVAAVISVLAGSPVLPASPALAASSGLSPGVHVDPGSPAGKQYAIPITTGRQVGNPTGTSGSGTTNPPRFGTGVTASSSRGSRGPRGHGRRRSGVRSARHHRRVRSASASSPTGGDPPATEQVGQVGGSAWVPLAIGGAIVLLLGVGGGLALQRRRADS